MSYVVVATYRAQEGAAEEVKEHLKRMVTPTNQEPGCRSYDVYRSVEDDGVFVLVEVYEDEESFQQHRAASHFDEHIVNGAIPLLTHREVVRAAPLR
jgi:quinol monooxygenase YgiN